MLREVESVADRVAIIRAGRIVDVDSVRGLRERAGQRVAFTFAAPPELAAFADVAELHDARLDGATLTGLLRGAPDALLKVAARHEVVAWSARDRDLEDLVLDVYRLGAAGVEASVGTNGGRDAR